MTDSDGIVLLAKRPGLTSFASLRNVKKALNTTKVGHTGTLDSFAEGLLVVCAGKLTKLCGQITAFDKTYEAVIHFGAETDTCEYTGKEIRKASIPTESSLRQAVEKWTGDIQQKPPLYSAIHVDGKRASDLVREGKTFDIPSRPVTVFSSEIKELKYGDGEGCEGSDRLVEFARIEFSVSKGTYIRSLARDIAESCGSAAYLTGLFRTKIGNFSVKESAGYSLLPSFNIENAFKKESEYKEVLSISDKEKEKDKSEEELKGKKGPRPFSEEDLQVQKEILETIQELTTETASLCGFETVYLSNKIAADSFRNGKPLRNAMFTKSLYDFPSECQIAVFEKDDFMLEESFCGLINKNAAGKVSYGFVIN
ncbi:MAG: tRNA pseudouridine(55) synthase TruB [Treponema sp.]|nr:tRNA pseudouridine(55) synthase TruB [Treponema sp.]